MTRGSLPLVTTPTAESEPFDLSPSEAAELIGCHPDSLKRWATLGKIPALKTPGKWWRFRRSDIEAFKAKGGDR